MSRSLKIVLAFLGGLIAGEAIPIVWHILATTYLGIVDFRHLRSRRRRCDGRDCHQGADAGFAAGDASRDRGRPPDGMTAHGRAYWELIASI